MRTISILPWLLLVMLVLTFGICAIALDESDESGFYVSTKTWDGADHVYVYSQKTYSSISYRVVISTHWIENTLFIRVEGVHPPDGFGLTALGPARSQILDFEEIANGTYNIVLMWDRSAKSYLVTKQGGNITLSQH